MVLDGGGVWVWGFGGFLSHEGGVGALFGCEMAAGEGAKDDHLQALAGAEPGLAGDEPVVKAKKNSKAAASFFTPLSKKTKVDASVEAVKKVEEVGNDDDFQEPPAILATVPDKRPSRKKAKAGKDQKREADNDPPLLDAQTEGLLSDQRLEVAPSPTKKQTRASPAKKKRKAQLNVADSKPSIGVHGPDLFLQARLAAEENARLSAGKATHPFFARPKAGGARCLVTDETVQSMNGRSLNPAPDRAEKTIRMSPLKPPHPFFSRQNLGSVRTTGIDESQSNYESDTLPPCLPLHITQNTPEEDAKLAWNPNWTWRNMPVKSDCEEIEGTWSFSSYQPSYTWTWPSSKKRKRRGRPVSEVAAFGRVIEYLTGKDAGTQSLLSEEVESNAETQKLLEKFSAYYYPCGHKDSFEHYSALIQPLIERQVKPSSSRNPLWTDRYQPQTSQEVCGNKEGVKSLSSWLQSWREKVLKQKGASKNKEENESSSSDDDSDFEDSPSEIDDNDDLHNCLLVTGPVGCGKSAAIYACSMEHGFTVIEVNASECRSGALIKHKFKEAMESHGLTKRRSTTQVDASDGQMDVEHMFKQGEPCRRSISFNEEPENQLPLSQGVCRNNVPSSSLRGLRVILFEDVDIVFEEDSGFMGALALLARTSKCPIIFSSNSQKPVLPQVTGLQEIRFEQPSTAELVAHAYMVCMAEGVSCSPYIVEHIVKNSDHDLRKLLMLLQFWTQGSPSDTKYLKDASSVENPRVLHSTKHDPNLVNCLLQLDGCPQVPATRIHAADKKLSSEKLNSIESDYDCNEQKPRNDSMDSNAGICEEPGSSENSKKRSLDSYWLYAHDCQHRVLPLLFPNTEPCRVTAEISGCLEDGNQKVMAMIDHEISQWSRHRFDLLQAKEDAEFEARKALRRLQAAARREAKASENFSFTKLIQSSYDSPVARSASNECIKDTLSLLEGHESSSSEEREVDIVHDEDMCELRLSGVKTFGPTLENEECVKLNARRSLETEWVISGPNCTLGLDSDVPASCVINLGVNSSQQSVDLPVPIAEAGSQSTHLPKESSVPLRIEEACLYTPLKDEKLDLNPVPTANLAIHNDVEIPLNAGEESCKPDSSLEHKILNLASSEMEERWSALRSLQLNTSITPGLDTNILLDDVLHDLSACDFLSCRAAAASKASMEQQRLGYDDYSEDNSGDNCTESAAVLAQLRLNQALNIISPSNSLCSDSWQVGPSVLQHEAVREEKQVCEDERVSLLLPQRFRLSGRLARLDYLLFQSQLTPSRAGSEGGTGRATRQRKLI
ncbi:hypothetical protein M758_1G188600 [Ceratodon purpureus]|nr:hypothetical protein M758_1G188600 [Ceratodon purpureus]